MRTMRVSKAQADALLKRKAAPKVKGEGSGLTTPGGPVDTVFKPCGHRAMHPQGVRGQFTCPECGVRAKSIVTHDERGDPAHVGNGETKEAEIV